MIKSVPSILLLSFQESGEHKELGLVNHPRYGMFANNKENQEIYQCSLHQNETRQYDTHGHFVAVVLCSERLRFRVLSEAHHIAAGYHNQHCGSR